MFQTLNKGLHLLQGLQIICSKAKQICVHHNSYMDTYWYKPLPSSVGTTLPLSSTDPTTSHSTSSLGDPCSVVAQPRSAQGQTITSTESRWAQKHSRVLSRLTTPTQGDKRQEEFVGKNCVLFDLLASLEEKALLLLVPLGTAVTAVLGHHEVQKQEVWQVVSQFLAGVNI